jgi:hypothetical protein
MSAPERLPSLDDLIETGAIDIRVWAIEWSPPLGPRGIDHGHKPVKWKCCITPTNATRPMFVAIRKTATEADRDCRLAFYQHFAKNPSRFPPPKTPPDFPSVAPAPDDDDGMDMI